MMHVDWMAANKGKLSWDPDDPTPYEDFRTGLTFADVKQSLWNWSTNPKDWVYRRRHTVLGFWHMLKLRAYVEYENYLDEIQERMEEVGQ